MKGTASSIRVTAVQLLSWFAYVCMYRVQDLPASLQIELMRHRYSDLLARVPFFANLSMTALDELCQTMKSVSLTPGDPIVFKGEIANELLILSQGIARSSTKGDDSAYQTYTVGCFWVRTQEIIMAMLYV